MKVNHLRILFPPIFLIALFYTRIAGLTWGFPYPFHPDERNMIYAIEQLRCSAGPWIECMNPHFYAYGQFPLYIGFGLLKLSQLAMGRISDLVTYVEAATALRLISLVSSLLTVGISFFLMKVLLEKKRLTDGTTLLFLALPLVFSPALIQFAHFGTTEALLMFLFMSLVFVGIRFIENTISFDRFIFLSAILLGIATGTKISSGIFAGVPVIALFFSYISTNNSSLPKYILRLLQLAAVATCVAFASSPHNLLHLPDFLGALKYESEVARGTLEVFYTRQYFMSVPVFFQVINVFPYALGWPVFIFALLGLLTLPHTRANLFLRLSFLVYFLPSAFLYTKWVRFMAPILPLMIVFSILFVARFYKKVPHFALGLVIAIMCIPGILFLSVYQTYDSRMAASEWVNQNIPSGAYILSETANVVDIPYATIQPGMENQYTVVSFDFYNVDSDPVIRKKFDEEIARADYILVPSRRVFANHTCTFSDLGFSPDRCEELKKRYPVLNDYYKRLFDGSLGFGEIARFDSFPRIELFGLRYVFDDEQAEETWTVFDHPVVRVYKRLE